MYVCERRMYVCARMYACERRMYVSARRMYVKGECMYVQEECMYVKGEYMYVTGECMYVRVRIYVCERARMNNVLRWLLISFHYIVEHSTILIQNWIKIKVKTIMFTSNRGDNAAAIIFQSHNIKMTMNKEGVNFGLLWYYYGLMCSGHTLPMTPQIYHQRNPNQMPPGMITNMHYHRAGKKEEPEADRRDSLSGVFDRESPNDLDPDDWLSGDKTEPWISFDDMGAYSAITPWPYFPWQIERPAEGTTPSKMWSDLERHIQQQKAREQWSRAQDTQRMDSMEPNTTQRPLTSRHQHIPKNYLFFQ